MKNCAFCSEEIKERIIIENNLAYAFPSNKPIGVAHILIVPKRCVKTWDDMDKEEQGAIFDLREKLKPALEKAFGAVGFNFAWNEGESSGQSVAHFHFHIVPRTKDDKSMYGYEPREFLYRRPFSKETTPSEKLREIAEITKKNLSV